MMLYRPTYTRDGKKHTAQTYWVKFYVQGKRRFVSTGVRDKSAAAVRAGEIVKAAELRAAGVETYADTREQRVADLLQEYARELRRRGRADRYVADTEARLTRLLKGVANLVDVTPERIRRLLEKIGATMDGRRIVEEPDAAEPASGVPEPRRRKNAAKPKPKHDRVSARTLNYYRVALHGFFVWLVREGRWATNPVTAVAPAAGGEPWRRRRALSSDELARLIAAAPVERALLYRMAATTGLRRSELASLRWTDVDLDGATVTVRASAAKNRKEAIQPLPGSTVAALRAFRGDAGGGARVFSALSDIFDYRSDLQAAGIAYETTEGTADFHALRSAYATALARAGVSLALAQRLMRHSTPVLTANVYTRLELHDERAAVAKIDPETLARARAEAEGKARADAARAGQAPATTAAPGVLVPPLVPTGRASLRDASSRFVEVEDGGSAVQATRKGRKGPKSRHSKVEAPRGIEPRYTDLQSTRALARVLGTGSEIRCSGAVTCDPRVIGRRHGASPGGTQLGGTPSRAGTPQGTPTPPAPVTTPTENST